MSNHDVIVLGVGAMGSAACFHLAARGARVLGLERFSAPNDRGSSHGESRIIRRAYAEGADYVPLLDRAYQLWDELDAITEESLFHRVGLAYYGLRDSELLASVERSSELYGVPIEQLDRQAAIERFPDYLPPQGFRAIFEPDAGYLASEACIEAYVAGARSAGAEVRENEEVLGWVVDDEGVEVRTDQATYSAGALVLAAGAWTRPLLGELSVPLEVRRVPLFWFRNQAGTHSLERVPCFLMDLEHGLFYGFPARDPHGVKVAMHAPLEPVGEPLAIDRDIHDSDLEPIHRSSYMVLPHVAPPATHSAVCMYTMTPDEHFVIDRHPGHENVVFAAGFSGHGFKFASVVGEVLADLALEGATRHPVEFLGPGRFASH